MVQANVIEVNSTAVFLAALSSMAVGSIWYAKGAFGQHWQNLAKLNQKNMKEQAPKALAIAFFSSLLMAYVLAHTIFLSNYFFHHSYVFQHSFMQDAVTTGFWMWLGFQGLRVVMHDAFEQRRKKLTLINIGNDLATVMVMAVIIGWFQP